MVFPAVTSSLEIRDITGARSDTIGSVKHIIVGLNAHTFSRNRTSKMIGASVAAGIKLHVIGIELTHDWGTYPQMF